MNRKSTFSRNNGRSTFKCNVCGRMTRDVDQGGTDLCPEDYELAGMDNTINDDGRKATFDEVGQGIQLLIKIAKRGGNAIESAKSNDYVFNQYDIKGIEAMMASKPASKAAWKGAKEAKVDAVVAGYTAAQDFRAHTLRLVAAGRTLKASAKNRKDAKTRAALIQVLEQAISELKAGC